MVMPVSFVEVVQQSMYRRDIDDVGKIQITDVSLGRYDAVQFTPDSLLALDQRLFGPLPFGDVIGVNTGNIEPGDEIARSRRRPCPR